MQAAQFEEQKRANREQERQGKQRIAQGWASLAARQAKSKDNNKQERQGNVLTSPAMGIKMVAGIPTTPYIQRGNKALRYNNTADKTQNRDFITSANNFARLYHKDENIVKFLGGGRKPEEISEKEMITMRMNAAMADPRFGMQWAAEIDDEEEFANAFNLFKEGWGLSDKEVLEQVRKLI